MEFNQEVEVSEGVGASLIDVSSDVVDCVIVEGVTMFSRPLEDLVVELGGGD